MFRGGGENFLATPLAKRNATGTYIYMHYDTICPAADNSFSLQCDYSKQLPNLSVNWVNL